jgi:hypothetical protein
MLKKFIGLVRRARYFKSTLDMNELPDASEDQSQDLDLSEEMDSMIENGNSKK